MAALKDIVVDCGRPSMVARFWAAALDGYQVAAYDEAELVRLREMGVDDIEDDPSVLVEPVDGIGPRFFFQFIPEPRAVKNRWHLDLTASADIACELNRLTELGAVLKAEFDGHIVLADVEGNEFCLLR